MTDIVEVPAAPVVPPFPALGSNNYNDEAYAAGVALPGLSAGIHAIGVSAETNATVAKEQAQAAQVTHEQAAIEVMAIKDAAVLDVTAIKTAAVTETTAIKDAAVLDVTAIKTAAVTETTAIKEAALGYRDDAALSAQAAQSAADFVGRWDGLSGPLAPPATAWHAGKFWVLLDALPDVAAAEPGVAAAWSGVGSGVPHIAYDDRATLRSVQGATGDQAVADGLGLFVFVAASDEPDDDETCFATAAGRWLLQAPHPDLLASWQLPDDSARDESIESLGYILRAAAACPVTSVAAVSQATFTVTVPGAVAGAAVLATPMAALDARLAISARATGANTVTVTLSNPSAAVTTAGSIPASWQVTVFMEI